MFRHTDRFTVFFEIKRRTATVKKTVLHESNIKFFAVVS